MSVPAVASAVAPAGGSRKVNDTASVSRGMSDAPADLFQDLMQALSAVANATLTSTDGVAVVASGPALATDTPLPTGPAGSPALPPEFLGLGLVFVQPLTLPPMLPMLPSSPSTASVTAEDGAQPQGIRMATATLPAADGATNDAVTGVPSVLGLVRSQTPSSLTTVPSDVAATATTPTATPAQRLPTPEPVAFNRRLAADQVSVRTAPPGCGAATDSPAASTDMPREPAPLSLAPDAAGSVRPVATQNLEFAGVYRNALQADPTSPAFPTELVSEVRFLLKGGLQHAELRMNPVELGPIQIDLSLNAQVADIGFTAAHATTREGIAQSLPQLREMLSSQGLSLGQTSVGAEAQNHQQAQQDRVLPDSPPRPNSNEVSSAPMAVRVNGAASPALGVLDLYA